MHGLRPFRRQPWSRRPSRRPVVRPVSRWMKRRKERVRPANSRWAKKLWWIWRQMDNSPPVRRLRWMRWLPKGLRLRRLRRLRLRGLPTNPSCGSELASPVTRPRVKPGRRSLRRWRIGSSSRGAGWQARATRQSRKAGRYRRRISRSPRFRSMSTRPRMPTCGGFSTRAGCRLVMRCGSKNSSITSATTIRSPRVIRPSR